jgi:hypothetical protein
MSGPSTTDTTAPQDDAGYTRDDYAADLGLPVELLDELRIETITVNGHLVVRIPYFDTAMEEKAVRRRHARDGDLKFTWNKGDKPRLYGEWRLEAAREAGHIVICEGESDSQRLWAQGIPAAGVPGASSWKEAWAALLDGIETIYVVIEPDKGGQAMRRWLAKSAIRHRARLIEMPAAAKDPNALYLADPAGFERAWASLVEEAPPWRDIKDAEDAAEAEAAWELCRDLASCPDIPQRFVETLWRSGLVGEEHALKLLFLCLTSRLTERPVSAVMKAPSSAGKSFLVQTVLGYMPDAAHYDLTASSERALAYSQEPLEHRFLVVYEAAGMGEFASMLARTLLSEGCVRYETVESTPTGLVPRLIERKGPTGMLLTTTDIGIHPENETRMFSIPVNDTPAQTAAILRAQASGQRPTSEDVELWCALQVWLGAQPAEVIIPFAPALAELTRPVGLRLRRDFPAMLTLIATHALLHRATREQDDEGRIIATMDDYRAVHALVAEIIDAGVESSVPRSLRETVIAVEELKAENVYSVTYQRLAAKLGLDRSAARRRALQCIQRGLLVNDETRKGQPAKLKLGDGLPERDEAIVPTPEQLTAGAVAQVASAAPIPPLPPDGETEEIL